MRQNTLFIAFMLFLAAVIIFICLSILCVVVDYTSRSYIKTETDLVQLPADTSGFASRKECREKRFAFLTNKYGQYAK